MIILARSTPADPQAASSKLHLFNRGLSPFDHSKRGLQRRACVGAVPDHGRLPRHRPGHVRRCPLRCDQGRERPRAFRYGAIRDVPVAHVCPVKPADHIPASRNTSQSRADNPAASFCMALIVGGLRVLSLLSVETGEMAARSGGLGRSCSGDRAMIKSGFPTNEAMKQITL